jgi:putative ABC transport system permease protein
MTSRLRPMLRLAGRELLRRKARTLAVVIGGALAFFLFAGVEALDSGVSAAIGDDAKSRALVVYRENRYCPQTSRLPESYLERLRSIDGVAAALPLRLYMNGCRANLDLVLFHGTLPAALESSREIGIVEGSFAAFAADPSTALLGRAFAARRGLDVGAAFRFGGLDVRIAGVVASSDPAKEDCVYVHLPTLQRAIDRGETGIVTQFEIEVAEGYEPRAVAQAIDAAFATREEPTATFSRSEFRRRAIAELIDLMAFARAFGITGVIVLLVVLANALMLSVAERRREHALLLALGYRGTDLAISIAASALLLGIIAAMVGVAALLAFVGLQSPSVGIEGVPIQLRVDAAALLRSVSALLAAVLLATPVPLIAALRIEPALALRQA